MNLVSGGGTVALLYSFTAGQCEASWIVKENLDNEVEEFREFFSGEIYLDEHQHFYGPLKRVGGYGGLLNLKVVSAIRNSKAKGNLKGEGWTMGGVLVVGPQDQGILYEHLETKFGVRCNIEDVLAAVKQIKQ